MTSEYRCREQLANTVDTRSNFEWYFIINMSTRLYSYEYKTLLIYLKVYIFSFESKLFIYKKFYYTIYLYL